MFGRPSNAKVATGLILAIVGLAPASAARHRCPTGIDVFGPYTVPYGGEVGKMYTTLRGFLWQHWHERRSACAQVTSTSIEESVRCTNMYIIEADKHGRWRIVNEWKCGPGGRGWPRATSGKSTWYSVQRVPEGGAGWRDNKPFPDSEDLPSDSYVLVFRDISGRNESPL